MRYTLVSTAMLLAAAVSVPAAARDLPPDVVKLGCYLEADGVRTAAAVAYSEKRQAVRWEARWWNAKVGPDRIEWGPTSDSAIVRIKKQFRITIDRNTGRIHVRSADGHSVWGRCQRSS